MGVFETATQRSPSAAAEASLIAQAVQGDEAAFTRLYDMYYDRVYRYVYYRVGRAEDAEDLTQKVFLEAWRALGRYRITESPFPAWLITIAHNMTVSFFRSRKVVSPITYDVADGDGVSHPEQVVEGHHEQERIRQLVQKLKPEYQQVITMRFLEDFQYQEIAATMGKSEGNVRVIQHRALQRLRALLDKEAS